MCCAVPVPTDNPPPDTAGSAGLRPGQDATSAGGPTAGSRAGRSGPHGVLARARADLRHGRSWKARDRLAGHLTSHRDPEALDLLGQVHYDMGDLPAAGAAWFGSARRGADVDEAVAAWRERHGDDFGQMWRSIPRAMRAEPRTARLEALRRKAIDQDRRDGHTDRGPDRPGPQKHVPDALRGVDPAKVIAWVLAAVFVVCSIVGLITILNWVVS